jgi:hypothetical protein
MANVQAFMRHANKMKENKLFFNKPFALKSGFKEQLFTMAEMHLGKDINFLHGDAQSVLRYIRDVIGPKLREFYGMNFMRILEDSTTEAETHLDIEHMLLLLYKLKSVGADQEVHTAMGLLYYISYHQLDDEWGQIAKIAPKNKVTPMFELDARYFQWRRCNFVLRKYMLQMSAPEGYQAFYFEKPYLSHIAYLMTQDMTMEDAEKTVKSMTGGMFYSFLPLHIESQLLPGILRGEFDTSVMDGPMAQTYIRDTKRIEKEIPVDRTQNVYNLIVKPPMIDMMGMVINNLDSVVAQNRAIHPSDVQVYHISPFRVGVLVRNGLPITEALPSMGHFFKPVPELDLANIIQGEFL